MMVEDTREPPVPLKFNDEIIRGGGGGGGVPGPRYEYVNHPSHYGGGTIYETIKVLEAWLTPEEFRGWLKGTIIKYHSRIGKKPGENYEKELGKIQFYTNYLVEFNKRSPK